MFFAYNFAELVTKFQEGYRSFENVQETIYIEISNEYIKYPMRYENLCEIIFNLNCTCVNDRKLSSFITW